MLFKTSFAIFLLAAASMAAPINSPQELIVFNPKITAPREHMSWPKGSKQEVKWGKCLGQYLKTTALN